VYKGQDYTTVAARPNGAETKAAGRKVMVNVTGTDRPTETKVTVTDAALDVTVSTHPNWAEPNAGNILRMIRWYSLSILAIFRGCS